MALVLSSVVPTLVLAFVLLMVDLSTATKLVVVGTIAGALVGGWIIWGLGRVVASMGTLMGRDSALTGFEHRQDEVGTLMASYNKLLATVEQQATEINTFATRLSSAYEELESTNALLKESVFKDEVTGFYNRRFLLLRLDEEVSRWRRFRLPVSVVLLEVEELREVADASGYAAYEEALAAFAWVLAELSHGINVLARYDGSAP